VGGALGATVLIAGSGCGDSNAADRSVPDASIGGSRPDGSNDRGDGTAGDCLGCNEAAAPNCPPGSGLGCYVNSKCPNGGTTRITGTVYDPAGRNPLANVGVYVPEHPDQLPALATGTSICHSCDTSIRNAVTFTFSDEAGDFNLAGVPTGDNVPLVIQLGKWRRTIIVPHVSDCRTTELPSSGIGQARLPRNQTEGSLPQMAVLTGGCDNVACFLRGVGVDASEFSAPGAGGRVDVYQGLGDTGPGAALSNGVAGDCTTASCPLWSSKTVLEAYDVLFLGCECSEHNETKPSWSLLTMRDWFAEGPMVFATHSQTTWFKNGPADLQSVASWSSGPASGAAGPFIVNTTFQGGMNLNTWLADVGATDANGFLPVDPADVSTSVTAVASPTIAWINDRGAAVADGGAQSGNVKALTARMRAGDVDAAFVIPEYCGWLNVTDIHPGGGQALQEVNSDGSITAAPVPAACGGGPLNAGDKALEYLLFNQTICADTGGGVPPPPRPPPGDL
jgi:hypothetical protein